jgi:hypothetical protein
MLPRPVVDTDARLAMGRPGPDEYNVRIAPGKNSPIKHGTLFDIKVKPKMPHKEMGNDSPGPAKYFVKGELDQYTLKEQIANVKVSPDVTERTRRRRHPQVESVCPGTASSQYSTLGDLPAGGLRILDRWQDLIENESGGKKNSVSTRLASESVVSSESFDGDGGTPRQSVLNHSPSAPF